GRWPRSRPPEFRTWEWLRRCLIRRPHRQRRPDAGVHVTPRDKDRTNLKYAAAIGISAVAHAVFLYLVLFALPRWLKTDQTPPPAYTVTIVDNLPAGDLGTHLPRLARRHQQLAENQSPREQEA